MGEFSEAPKEVQKDLSPRLDFDAMLPDLREWGFDDIEQKRIRFQVEVLNEAFDLLDYSGPMPDFSPQKHLVIQGEPRIGGLILPKDADDMHLPTIYIDSSQTPGHNNGIGIVPFWLTPEDHHRIMVETLLEEAKHYVDYKSGLDVKSRHEPGDLGYPLQSHEQRAVEFVKKNSFLVTEKFRDFVTCYK